MPIRRRPFLARALLAGLAAAAAPAQALQLTASGGSMPGALAFDVFPALSPFEFGAVFPSLNQGPTPLSLFDPNDTRTLGIGTDLLGNAWTGLFGLDLHLRIGPLPFGTAPALLDQAIFFQAVTPLGFPTLIDRISNVAAVRLGFANTFRGRNATFVDDRAFATVLPRADGSWMVAGGARGQLLAQSARQTTEIYDPVTDAFTFGPNLTTPRSLHTMTQLLDGRWLFCGGVNVTNDPQASCEVYDPATDAFTAVAPMLVPRTGHTATLLQDGRVLVTGGLRAMTVTPTQLSAIRDATETTEIYDPVADTWTAGPNLRTPRAGHIAIRRPNGRVLLAGGISWDNVIIIGWLPAIRSSCDLFDPVANTIAAGPAMATARSLTDPVDLGNDRWLVAGGIAALTLTNAGTPTANAEIYDAAANTWTPVGPLATARGNHRAWPLGGGRFLLAGGASGSILSPVPLASTEVFSLQTNTFTAGPPMVAARAGAAEFLTPQGQVQLFGGGTSNGSISNTSEWYYF